MQHSSTELGNGSWAAGEQAQKLGADLYMQRADDAEEAESGAECRGRLVSFLVTIVPSTAEAWTTARKIMQLRPNSRPS